MRLNNALAAIFLGAAQMAFVLHAPLVRLLLILSIQVESRAPLRLDELARFLPTSRPGACSASAPSEEAVAVRAAQRAEHYRAARRAAAGAAWGSTP